MSPLWITVIVVIVCVFALAAVSDFRRRRARELDKSTSTPGNYARYRRETQNRTDKLTGPGH